VGIGISQEVQMCSWVYKGLANEARERAARASNPSIRDNIEAVAKEWSTLAVAGAQLAIS
jgi:hypothetical protein